MGDNEASLTKTAKAAYTNSSLYQQDLIEMQRAAKLLEKFLSICGIQKSVVSSYVDIEDMTLFVMDHKGMEMLTLFASRLCPDCKAKMPIKLGYFEYYDYENNSKVFDKVLVQLGKWLSTRHLCEFRDNKNKSDIGFRP
jgi:hypothetical protein